MSNHVYIVSIAPYVTADTKFRWARYRVPAAPKGGYSKTRVNDGVDSLYTGQDRWVPMAQPARSVAEDVIRGVEDHGVFIIDTEEPTEEQLAEAKKRRLAFLHKAISDADDSWRQFGQRTLISTHAQWACDELGVKRDWHSDVTELTECPACAGKIRPGIVKCSHCGAILDRERAKEFFPELFQTAGGSSVEAKTTPQLSASPKKGSGARV